MSYIWFVQLLSLGLILHADIFGGTAATNCADLGGIACYDGACFPTHWWCDGEADCEDKSDEANCTDKHVYHTCGPTRFQCHNSLLDSRCIELEWKCDGKHDCSDGSDEIGCAHTCGPHRKMCDQDLCLPVEYLCDGDNDCIDGEDEKNCPNTACNKGYFGHNCLHKCSIDCADQLCQPNNGTCLSCIPGKQGLLCDKECNKGYFGLNCSHKCSTDCADEQCQSNNGTCLSCIPGKQGMLCDEACNIEYFGHNCSQKCSSDCADQLCQPSNGTCLSCIPGKQGLLCEKACNKGYYGLNCSNNCSTNCTDQLCQPTNGTCLSCIPGKQGVLCDKACNKGFYGLHCSNNCSTVCTDQLCQPTNGTCLSCITGKQGLLCDKDVDPDESPPTAIIWGLVVAVPVLVALIAVGVFLWRRSRHTNDEHKRTTPHEIQNLTETDSRRDMESNAGKPTSHKVVRGQAKNRAIRKQDNSQDDTDVHQLQFVGGDNNCDPTLRDTPSMFNDMDNATTKHTQKYQKQSNDSVFICTD